MEARVGLVALATLVALVASCAEPPRDNAAAHVPGVEHPTGRAPAPEPTITNSIAAPTAVPDPALRMSAEHDPPATTSSPNTAAPVVRAPEAVPSFMRVTDHGPLTIDPTWHASPALQSCMEHAIGASGLDGLLANHSFGLALVNLTGDKLEHPEAAFASERLTLYGASIAKTLVLAAAFVAREDARHGRLALAPVTPALAAMFRAGPAGLEPEFRPEFTTLLERMIRFSDNEAGTRIVELVTPLYIADVAWSLELYRPSLGGGLWAGLGFGSGPGLVPDPVSNSWHAASALALAKLFTLMAQERLVSPDAAREMKKVYADSPLFERFSKALVNHRPGSVIYRKTGTYFGTETTWAHESALVERGALRYVASAVCMGKVCEVGLGALILLLDDCVVASP